MGTVTFRKSKKAFDLSNENMLDFQFRLILVDLNNESQSIASKPTMGSVPQNLNSETEISFCIPSLWGQAVYEHSRGFVDSNGLVVIRVELEALSLSPEAPFSSFPSYLTSQQSLSRACPANKLAMGKILQSAKEMKVRGNLLVRAGNHSSALEMFGRGIDTLTAESQLNGHVAVAELWALSSQAHMSLDEPTQALKAAEKCRTLRPTWPRAYHRLVVAHIALNNSTTAMDLVGRGFRALEETRGRMTPEEVQEYTVLFSQLKEDALECIQLNMFTPQPPAVKKQAVVVAPTSVPVVCENVPVLTIESIPTTVDMVHDLDAKKRKLHLKSKKRKAEKRKDVASPAEPGSSHEHFETVSVCTTNESQSVTSKDNAEESSLKCEETPLSVCMDTPPASPHQSRTSQLKTFLRIPSHSEESGKPSQEVHSPTACWDSLSNAPSEG
eukprot:gene32620-40253_t